MFDKVYPFQKLCNTYTGKDNPTNYIQYKFKGKKRFYLVTLDVFSFGVVAIKFCALKDKNNGNRYKLIYNDEKGDPSAIISTCVRIMLDHLKAYPEASFAFYASPREAVEEMEDREKAYFRAARFRIYERVMTNLFSTKYFLHYRDKKNQMYVLLNKKQKRKKVCMKKLGDYILKNYNLILEIDR